MSLKGGGVGFDWDICVASGDEMTDTLNWETRICTDCGYFETYLNELEWLGKIKNNQWKNWKKAT